MKSKFNSPLIVENRTRFGEIDNSLSEYLFEIDTLEHHSGALEDVDIKRFAGC